jgi:hypothetical protein
VGNFMKGKDDRSYWRSAFVGETGGTCGIGKGIEKWNPSKEAKYSDSNPYLSL